MCVPPRRSRGVRCARVGRCSLYLLYWYKSANTDAEGRFSDYFSFTGTKVELLKQEAAVRRGEVREGGGVWRVRVCLVQHVVHAVWLDGGDSCLFALLSRPSSGVCGGGGVCLGGWVGGWVGVLVCVRVSYYF